MLDKISTITCIGAGTMGIKIAVRAAVFGQSARVYDINPAVLQNAPQTATNEIEAFGQADLQKEATDVILARISFHDDLAAAIAGTQLIIEAAPENLELKRRIFAELDRLAPPDVILATNSSSIPVSRLEDVTQGRERVLNLHFYITVTGTSPFADIMRGSVTSDDCFERGRDWLENIGCVALVVKKECMGFVFNRVWHAIKKDALKIWAGGHADLRDVDRAWMLFSGMPAGPFASMDVVGLDVVYDIEKSYYDDSNNPDDMPPAELKAMVEQGLLGMKTGKGFYDWSDPEFLHPDFARPKKKKQS